MQKSTLLVKPSVNRKATRTNGAVKDPIGMTALFHFSNN